MALCVLEFMVEMIVETSGSLTAEMVADFGGRRESSSGGLNPRVSQLMTSPEVLLVSMLSISSLSGLAMLFFY